jgi:iron(III) transport system substrate-binding protein
MLTAARSVLALVVTATLLALAAVTPAAAQKQTVVIYTAIENEQIAEYKKAYEKSLPNLEVKMLRLSTGDIAARFMAEKDNMQADVIWGVGATNMLQFKNAGLLEPYAPKGLDRIQPLFRDKATPPSWVGLDVYMSAFCFNTDTAKKHNLPKPASWADLTKPVYKGHVVMPNPASSGTGYLSVVSILQRVGEAEGWKYLDALDKNIAEYTKSGSKPCKDSAAGERAVGVSFEYVAHEMKKKGAPVEMVLPKEGSGYEIEANGLTRKGAKNPAARQFLDWAITDESMKIAAQFFAAVGVKGMPVPEGLPKDISKVVFPNDFDWSAKNRDRILAEWQKRYAK